MARLFLFIGLLMLGGAAFVVNDTTKMSVKDPNYKFDLQAYASAAPDRMRNSWENDWGPRIAALPDTARTMVENWKNPPEEQLAQTDRLGNLKARNTSIARNGVSIDDLSSMTPMEIYQNRQAIVKGLTQATKKQMSGVFN